jgi:hypothetical protein
MFRGTFALLLIAEAIIFLTIFAGESFTTVQATRPA